MTLAEVKNLPLYWFTKLSLGIERGELDEAGRAIEQLKRIGINVNIRFVKPNHQEATHAS